MLPQSKLFLWALLSMLLAAAPSLPAQTTAFTYQGRLFDSNAPASANYDFQFTAYDAASNGTLVAGPVAISNQPVSNGLFTVTLDFGAGVFTGADRWLAIGVKSNGAAAFVTLNGRQKVTPAPYALFAPSAASVSGVLAVSNLPASVALLNGNQTFTGLVQFNNPSNSYTGNGGGLTNVQLASLNSGGTFSSSGNFRLASTPATGSQPVAVAIADFNRDGLMDVACADTGDGAVITFTNGGTAGFVAASTNAQGGGAQPSAVVAADVNGDGWPDLIVANAGLNSISVLTNSGSHSFVLASTLGNVAAPIGLITADFNGDGKPDLVVANAGGTSLTVFTNTGVGGMVLAAQPNLTTSQSAVAVADVNGDGRPDLISAEPSFGFLTVFTNNGNAQFTFVANTPAVGSSPRAIASGDFNGDGRVDLACVNFNTATMVILTNTGGGVFSLGSTYNTGLQPTALVATNLGGGPRPDLLCANGGTNLITIFYNNGGGAFTSFQNLQVGQNPDGLAVGDLNGDGRPDLVATSTASNTLWVMLNAVTFRTGPLSVWGGFSVNSNVIFYPGTGSNIGINTTNPAFALDVRGTVNATGGFQQVSDSRFKTNIATLTDALEKIAALRGVEYDWRRTDYPEMNFDASRQLGFIAQELKQVLPEAVKQDAEGHYSISYSEVIPVLVEALKEEQQSNAAAMKESAEKIRALEKRLEALEKSAGSPAKSGR